MSNEDIYTARIPAELKWAVDALVRIYVGTGSLNDIDFVLGTVARLRKNVEFDSPGPTLTIDGHKCCGNCNNSRKTT